MQHLDGDLALVPQVTGEVDGRHAAAAHLSLNAVAAGESGGDALEQLGLTRHATLLRLERLKDASWRG